MEPRTADATPPAVVPEVGGMKAMTAALAWDWPGRVALEPVTTGLINETYLVRVQQGTPAILQSLNTDIFSPRVHEDIEAVTAHLERAGLDTPRLIPTRDGRLWTEVGGQVWRCQTLLGDRTVEKLEEPADARTAGELVARFHVALRDLRWEFRSVRPGAHDTDAHLAGLNRAVDAHRDHRLYEQVAPLAEELAERWERWDGPRGLPRRVIHGDLKISNVRFEGARAVALIDLDTLAWGTLDIELGDALRSWCNPASEDAAETRFDLDLFEAAMTGYAAGVADDLPVDDEWHAFVPGVERIATELAARFARDALEERYFGWNAHFGGRGEHNLLRARGQAALARSVAAERAAAEGILGRVRG